MSRKHFSQIPTFLTNFDLNCLGLYQEMLRRCNDPRLEIRDCEHPMRPGTGWSLHFVPDSTTLPMPNCRSILDSLGGVGGPDAHKFPVTPGFFCVKKRSDPLDDYDRAMKILG